MSPAGDLFDTVLVVAGVVLVVTGLVMFIRSKTSTQSSSVEAFGIKLNVTHPSLILVLAGVGLMLSPRLLPGPPDKTGKPEAVVAEAAKPLAPAVPTGPAPEAAIRPAPAAAAIAPPASPAAKPAATLPDVAPPAATARPLPRAPPPAFGAARPKRQEAKPASSRPAVKTATAEAGAPTSAVSSVEAVTPLSASAVEPVRPTLAYAALGLPSPRPFWNGETRASYTRRMLSGVQQAGREVLRMSTRELDLSPREFDAWLNESGQHARSRELCAASPAPRALLAARVETPFVYSSIESAFWPELRLRLFVCATRRMYSQQKTLSPQSGDAWPFATEFTSEIERFLRAYRGDLAD